MLQYSYSPNDFVRGQYLHFGHRVYIRHVFLFIVAVSFVTWGIIAQQERDDFASIVLYSIGAISGALIFMIKPVSLRRLAKEMAANPDQFIDVSITWDDSNITISRPHQTITYAWSGINSYKFDGKVLIFYCPGESYKLLPLYRFPKAECAEFMELLRKNVQ